MNSIYISEPHQTKFAVLTDIQFIAAALMTNYGRFATQKNNPGEADEVISVHKSGGDYCVTCRDQIVYTQKPLNPLLKCPL